MKIMAKKKIENFDNPLIPIDLSLTEAAFQELTLSEINTGTKDLFKNVRKSYREFVTFDEHLDARYEKPGSETRKKFEAKAQAFLASQITESSAITVDPETLGGTPVFSGTRIPIQNLIDHLKTEESVESFLLDFEGVTKLHVKRVVRKIMRFSD